MNRKISLWLCLIIAAGCVACGFFLGILATKTGRDFFVDLFTSEQAAEVGNPKVIRRDFYTLSYPSNWALDESDGDFDLDHYFSIDSPGDSYVAFQFNHFASSPEEDTQSHVDQLRELMMNPVLTPFTGYGSFEGAGQKIEGRIFGLRAEIRVFSATVEELSFTVTEYTYGEDKHLVKPGFDLIRQSFRLTPSGDPELAP